jgi:DNA-binding NtrC family response regulator
MTTKPHVLIVDDEEDSRSALQTVLGTWGYVTDVASEGREALQKASSLRPSLVITDLVMPDMDGLSLLNALQQELPRVPVIILTGRATVDTAVAAMRQGAYDYLTKPVDLDRLRLLIEKALDRARTLDEITILRRRVKEVWGLGRLIGRSAPMQEVHRLIEQAAATPAPVLIHGETGTGKELAHPPRAVRPHRRPFRGRQLRGHAGYPARERDLRPRARGLHGRA